MATQFRNTALLFLLFHLPLSLFCQVVIGKPWTIECGTSTSNAFQKTPSLNLRYVSPRFRWSDEELTVEEEKHIDRYKKSRLILEVIYTAPLKVLCVGLNTQYRFLKYKRFTMELSVGMKFFFIPGPDFATIPPLRTRHDVWYLNIGLLCQINLGVIAPFADIGADEIITIGTEVNFHSIYRKLKRRYDLHPREQQD